MSIVKLKPIPRGGKRLGLEQSKENYMRMPGTHFTWVPFKRDNSNEFLTGLTDEEAEDYGKRLGADLSKTSKYWEDMRHYIKESPSGHALVLTRAIEFVTYKAMCASPIIAESLSEWKDGSKPYADWYFENVEADAEAEAKQVDEKIEALSALNDSSLDRLRNLAKVLTLRPWGLSDQAVKGKLFTFIEKDIDQCKIFLELIHMKDATINVKALVEDALHYNVIRLTRTKDLAFDGDVLASTKDQLVTKLLAPENSLLRESLELKVETKK